jgi:hypothetical protein
MLQFNILAFNAVVTGTSPVYSDASLNDRIGEADYLGLHVIATQGAGTSPTVTVQVEHSADGIRWLNKQATAEINAIAVGSLGPPGNMTGEVSGKPGLGRARLRVQLGGTGPSAQVQVFLAGRPFRAF